MAADLATAREPITAHALSIDPATGRELARFPYHSPAECEAILASAWSGYRNWRARPLDSRAAMLAAVGQVLRDEIESLARGVTREMGKPITQARGEVLKCAALCDWYAAHAARLLAPEPADVGEDGDAVVAYLPIGPVLAVMPWNFPLWQALRAAVPIIVAGNAFVLKHADNVQGSAMALAAAFAKAGLPDGVFSVLNVPREALPELIADPRIAAVTVTAGVAAGAAVASEAGRNLKKSVLELGGTDPFIVLANADLDGAVAAAVAARFQNTGQVCIAAKRIILERPIADAFIGRFVDAVRALKLGDPLEEDTELGPMARPRLRAELHAQVADSIAKGATLLLGGVIPDTVGAYYPATVLTGVRPDMAVFREETFGPVAAIIVAEDVEEAISIANDSDYGLSGALWSADLSRARALARRIETGGVFINGMSASDPRVPIGGVKQSGYGRELSHFGLREFCNAQLVWTRPSGV